MGGDGSSTYRFPERRSQAGSADRNRETIARTLTPILRSLGEKKRLSVLEIGSGGGEQLATLAEYNAEVRFQPTEVDEKSCEEVNRLCADLPNVAACKLLDIDVEKEWQGSIRGEGCDAFDILLAINIIHIVPWTSVQSLFRASKREGVDHLILYGAFNEEGRFTSEGNKIFDRYLRDKSESFGLRDIGTELVPLAHECGLRLYRRIGMPSGNVSEG